MILSDGRSLKIELPADAPGPATVPVTWRRSSAGTSSTCWRAYIGGSAARAAQPKSSGSSHHTSFADEEAGHFPPEVLTARTFLFFGVATFRHSVMISPEPGWIFAPLICSSFNMKLVSTAISYRSLGHRSMALMLHWLSPIECADIRRKTQPQPERNTTMKTIRMLALSAAAFVLLFASGAKAQEKFGPMYFGVSCGGYAPAGTDLDDADAKTGFVGLMNFGYMFIRSSACRPTSGTPRPRATLT